MSTHDPMHNGPVKGPVAHAAYANLVTDDEFEEQANKLQKAINEDPNIDDPTNLSVFINKEDGTETIHLIGKAKSELDLRRAAEVAGEHKTDAQEIDNQLALA